MKEQISVMKRGKSLNALKRTKNTPMSSLAEKNIVSLK
jgi:hypothetical protein